MDSTLNSKTLIKLEKICGEKYLLRDRERIEPYSRDETPGLVSWPQAVILPGSTREIAAIMTLADQEGFVITPRGGGTGLAGGAVSTRGGLMVCLQRMNQLLEVDRENLVAVIEPGLITETLKQTVRKQGLFYPPDPASLESCSIGGNLATNAGGPSAVKYGVTRSYLSGLEAVLPGGNVIRWGGKARKNSTGYSLGQLLVGSEGTLGIITQATLRLIPLPLKQLCLWAPFPTAKQAIQAVAKIRRSNLVPSALEVISQEAAELLSEIEVFCPLKKQAAIYLLIELDGDDPDLEQAGNILEEHGALDILVAETRPEREKLWEARRKLTEAIKQHSPDHFRQDISIPTTQIPRFLQELTKNCRQEDLRSAVFGHAGDGNLHISIMRGAKPDENWDKKKDKLELSILELAVSLGGVISGEHGIGTVKRKYLKLNYSPDEITTMKAIKTALDPKNILNPGKVIPEL